MKFLLLSFSIITFYSSNATTYYFSANGDDIKNGTSASTPWKTLNKFNLISGTLKPGDNVLFKRGDVFYGNLVITRSGERGMPVTIGAYGTGAKPVITGFTTISKWVNTGNNTWQSATGISTLDTLNMVTVGDLNTPMGRFPNTGYLTYESAGDNTSITSSSLNASVTDWTGAEVAIRINRFTIKRNPVISASGGTLDYSGGGGKGQAGYGFFIQNDARTLDIQNEWYYDAITKKLEIFNAGMPTRVKAATIDTLVFLNNRAFIVINGLAFQGSNTTGIKILNGSNITIENCDFDYSGLSALDAYPGVQYLTVNNCTFNHTNDFALNAGASKNAVITNNIIKNTGVFPGMGTPGGGYKGIHAMGWRSTIAYNNVDSSGYNAIEFDGDSTIVQNNFVSNFGFVLDDGAGIYTFPQQGPRVNIKRTIRHNIIINGIGAYAGSTSTDNQADGIYLDGLSSDFNVVGNTVANTGEGIVLNNSANVSLDSNTLYNNNWQLHYENYSAKVPMTNISIHNNIFFCRLATQLTMHIKLQGSGMPASFSADNNYSAKPADDHALLNTATIGSGVTTQRSMATWQAFSGQDIHSHKLLKTIFDINDLRFEYNATSSGRVIKLDADYMDVKGVLYKGSITLAPYTSAVLIKTRAGANQSTGQDGAAEVQDYYATGRVVSYVMATVSGFMPLYCLLANTSRYYSFGSIFTKFLRLVSAFNPVFS